MSPLSKCAILTTITMGTAAAGVLLVANKDDRTLGIIDPKTSKQVAAIPEDGITGHEVIASPDGKFAYVPIYGNSGVGKPGTDGSNMIKVDLATRKVVGNLDFGKGVRPHCPQIGPKNHMLYVSTELDETISIIDPNTMKIVGTVPTGAKESHMFVISPDGKRAYTANVGPGSVSVIDLEAKKLIKTIPISGTTQRIAVTPDGKYVFTSDQTKPRVAVISTATNSVEKWIDIPGLGYGGAVTPDGKYFVLAVPTVSKVTVIDVKAMSVVKSIDVPKTPQFTVIPPDGKMAYVSCSATAKIVGINTSTWNVDTTIDAGKGADGLAWAK